MSRLLEWVEVTPLTQKVSLIGLFIVIWGGGFYWLVAQPMIEEKEDLVLRLQSLDQQVKKFSQYKRQYFTMQGELSRWKSIVDHQEESLGLEVPMSQVLAEMSNMGQETGVNVTLWKPDEAKGDSLHQMKKQLLQLHVEGGFHNVAQFLDHVQNLSKTMGVVAFSMHPADTANGIPTVQAVIDFIGYDGHAQTLANNSEMPVRTKPIEGRG